jgi:hypothetical protein
VVGELAVQIKNNTSNRGARRIYAAMLGERRHRSTAGRGGILQFLARCLRSVDPSPSMVRELSKEILDRFFTGNPNEPALYLPVCWLLASCINCADVVEHELSSQIAAMITSNEPESRLTALNLLFWLASSLNFPDDSCPHLPSESPLSLYWRELQAEYQTAYAQDIKAAAETDAGIRVQAYLQNLIELDDALKMPGGLSPFFADTPVRAFRSRYAAPFPYRIRNFLANGFQEDKLEELGQVGHYLLTHPQPPWVAGPVRTWRHDELGNPIQGDRSYPPMSMEVYLAASAIMLITIESMQAHEAPSEFGPLNDLYPYIKRRWQSEPDCPLPSLPVPEHFQQIFHEWADNTVNFIDASAGAPGH